MEANRRDLMRLGEATILKGLLNCLFRYGVSLIRPKLAGKFGGVILGVDFSIYSLIYYIFSKSQARFGLIASWLNYYHILKLPVKSKSGRYWPSANDFTLIALKNN